MSLPTGTRFGSYEITAQIGAGGMGEVYRARDGKLNRDVALKVLPSSLGRDAERLARFEREARTLAQLNHTNIANIYGVEDSTATTALVIELPWRADLVTPKVRRWPAVDSLGISETVRRLLAAGWRIPALRTARARRIP